MESMHHTLQVDVVIRDVIHMQQQWFMGMVEYGPQGFLDHCHRLLLNELCHRLGGSKMWLPSCCMAL